MTRVLPGYPLRTVASQTAAAAEMFYNKVKIGTPVVVGD